MTAIDDITAAWLRTNYLAGLPLVDATGAAIPDGPYTMQINAAIDNLEGKLGVSLRKKIVKTHPDAGLTLGEDYDEEGEALAYNKSSMQMYGYVNLPRNNVQSIERVRAYYADQLIYEFPIEWIILKKREGYFALVAGRGSFQELLIDNLGHVPLIYTRFIREDSLPGFWAIDYTYGMDGETELPAALVDWIGKTAAISMLGMLSAALARGVSNRSISMDGVSETRGFSLGSGKGLYGEMISTYQDGLDKQLDIKALRRRFRGLKVWSP